MSSPSSSSSVTSSAITVVLHNIQRTFNKQYFPFQQSTIKKGVQCFENKHGILIALEMGLGKTITSYGLSAVIQNLLVHFQQTSASVGRSSSFYMDVKTLIVCPRATIDSVWLNELQPMIKNQPDFCAVFYGPDRYNPEVVSRLQRAKVIVTTSNMILNDLKRFLEFREKGYILTKKTNQVKVPIHGNQNETEIRDPDDEYWFNLEFGRLGSFGEDDSENEFDYDDDDDDQNHTDDEDADVEEHNDLSTFGSFVNADDTDTDTDTQDDGNGKSKRSRINAKKKGKRNSTNQTKKRKRRRRGVCKNPFRQKKQYTTETQTVVTKEDLGFSLFEHHWVVIVEEAHWLRNGWKKKPNLNSNPKSSEITSTHNSMNSGDNSKISLADALYFLIRCRGHFTIAITGTPLGNRQEDMAGLVKSLIIPRLWSKSEWRNHRKPWMKTEFWLKANESQYKSALSEFYVRVVRSDVTNEIPPLPPKTEFVVYCALTPQQIEIGKELLKRAQKIHESRKTLVEKSDNASSCSSSHNQKSSTSSWAFQMLCVFGEMRQLCHAPYLLLKQINLDTDDILKQNVKASAILHIVNQLALPKGESVAVFMEWHQGTDKLMQVIRDCCPGQIPLRFDSSVSNKKGIENLQLFMAGQSQHRVFFCGIRCAVGFTLVRANHAIIVDPWFNPSVERQAAYRVYRMGQQKPVSVYRLIAAGPTIENHCIRYSQQYKSTKVISWACPDLNGNEYTMDTQSVLTFSKQCDMFFAEHDQSSSSSKSSADSYSAYLQQCDFAVDSNNSGAKFRMVDVASIVKPNPDVSASHSTHLRKGFNEHEDFDNNDENDYSLNIGDLCDPSPYSDSENEEVEVKKSAANPQTGSSSSSSKQKNDKLKSEILKQCDKMKQNIEHLWTKNFQTQVSIQTKDSLLSLTDVHFQLNLCEEKSLEKIDAEKRFSSIYEAIFCDTEKQTQLHPFLKYLKENLFDDKYIEICMG